MSTVIPFPVALSQFRAAAARPPLDPQAYVDHPGKPVRGSTLHVVTSVRSYCVKHHYSAEVSSGAVRAAITQLQNDAAPAAALTVALETADRLHNAEVDAAWKVSAR